MSFDWPGLLKWSLSYADGTGTPKEQMSAEDRSFLEGAIRHAMSLMEDGDAVVKDALAKLQDSNEGVVITALKVIERCLDDYPEIARYLHKMNGVKPLLSVVCHPNLEIIELALQDLNIALQNNIDLQDAVAKEKGLDVFLDCYEKNMSDSINVKCLGAISGLVKHHKDSEKEFVSRGGVALLVKAMQSQCDKLKRRACSLMQHLLNEDCIYKSEIEMHPWDEIASKLLSNRNVEESGYDVGLMSGLLFCTMLQQHRFTLAKCGYLSSMEKSICGRLEYAQSVLDKDPESAVDHEIEYLKDAMKLCKLPTKN